MSTIHICRDPGPPLLDIERGKPGECAMLGHLRTAHYSARRFAEADTPEAWEANWAALCFDPDRVAEAVERAIRCANRTNHACKRQARGLRQALRSAPDWPARVQIIAGIIEEAERV